MESKLPVLVILSKTTSRIGCNQPVLFRMKMKRMLLLLLLLLLLLFKEIDQTITSLIVLMIIISYPVVVDEYVLFLTPPDRVLLVASCHLTIPWPRRYRSCSMPWVPAVPYATGNVWRSNPTRCQ